WQWFRDHVVGIVAFLVGTASMVGYILYLWRSGALTDKFQKDRFLVALFRERNQAGRIIVSMVLAIIALIVHKGFVALLVGYLILLAGNLLWDAGAKDARAALIGVFNQFASIVVAKLQRIWHLIRRAIGSLAVGRGT